MGKIFNLLLFRVGKVLRHAQNIYMQCISDYGGVGVYNEFGVTSPLWGYTVRGDMG